MNDAGLDGPGQEQSSDQSVRDRRKNEDEGHDGLYDPGQAFLQPSRWWFASTAFPLIAGTFGPMASAFNICALIQSWRVDIPPGFGANESHGIRVLDPKWLLAINGVSLGCALIANFALLLNMTRRLSFSIAQPITIIGWYISSFLLIADLSSVIHIVKTPGKRRALTAAFYYGIWAAGIYFIIACLMVVTVYGAIRGYYPKDFKLLTSQRTLMLQTITFLIYMLGGAGVYSKIEGWQFSDALYFTSYTLLTVGIGDYAPQTHLGRGLLFPYAIGGIVVLGLVVSSIRSLVIERGRQKLGMRQVWKIRKQVLKRMEKDGNVDKITPVENEAQAAEVGMTEKERRREEFRLMRRIQDRARTRQQWTSLLTSGMAWMVLWFVGALVFYFAEHEQDWTYFQSLYFCYTTLLTIGYGDFKPFSNSGKSFFVFWSFLAVPSLTIVVSHMSDTVVKSIKDLTLYLGEFTLLPGEAGIKARLHQLSTGAKKLGKTSPFAPTDINGKDPKKDQQSLQTTSTSSENTVGDGSPPPLHTNPSSTTPHHYHHDLARELVAVLHHLNESPPRKYTYEEWARFLKLLGEEEDDSDRHRKPLVHGGREAEQVPEGQEGQEEGRGGQEFLLGEAAADKAAAPQSWSWLGDRSPLLVGGEMTEAEWVVRRLSRRLEMELKAFAEGVRRENGKLDVGEAK